MASDFLGTYNPTSVSLIISGLTASGFKDGTFVKIERLEKENYKTHVGAYGEVTRTANPNKATKISFTLKQMSPFNQKMDVLKMQPVAFPVMVKDKSSGLVAVADSTWVAEEPNEDFADEESGIEWVLVCASMIKARV